METNKDANKTEVDRTAQPKRPYVAPRLTEYGSISRLTQGTGATSNGDGGQMMML
jgi:hypothetical protein